MSTRYETSASLVSGVTQGDRKAEAAIFVKYQRTLLYILKKRCSDEDLAQDLSQETFRIVLERLRKQPLDDPDKLGAYLQNTAINLYIAYRRKSVRQNTVTDSDVVDLTSNNDEDQYLTLARLNACTAVRMLIMEMDNSRDQQILYRFYLDEMEKPLVCDELHITHRHFDRVISRARARFKKLVESRQDQSLKELLV